MDGPNLKYRKNNIFSMTNLSRYCLQVHFEPVPTTAQVETPQPITQMWGHYTPYNPFNQCHPQPPLDWQP